MKTIVTASVKKTAKIIKKGGIAAFPTETVYGLGANVYDEKAVNKIFKAKGRPADNPLIVHISNKRDIKVLTEGIPDHARKIIKHFFPGPIAVILKKSEIVPDIVTAGLGTIAIRMPSSKIALNLIKECGVPIAAPSSNLSGSPSPTSFLHVIQDLKGKIPCILTGPEAKYGLESTVVDCTGKHPVILRPGVITLEQLKNVDKNVKYQKRTGKILSPGQKYRHYAPKAKVRFIRNYELRIRDLKINIAYIGLNKKSAKKFAVVRVCRSNEEYAKHLFSFFRKCDLKGIKIIYCQRVHESGVGLAIMNRLRKAIIN